MGALLKFLLLALAVLWLWHSPALRGKKPGQVKPHRPPQPRPGPQTGTGPTGPTETMVACAHCGVHLPASESARNGRGDTFCGTAHRDLHP
jgi:uncharacterized protein